MMRQVSTNLSYDMSEYVDKACSVKKMTVSEYLRWLIYEDAKKERDRQFKELMDNENNVDIHA